MDFEVLRTETRLCCSCMYVHPVQIVKLRENNIIQGVPVEYDAVCCHCSQSDELFADEDMMRENHRNMMAAYHKKLEGMP